jgi:hypothetical protein
MGGGGEVGGRRGGGREEVEGREGDTAAATRERGNTNDRPSARGAGRQSWQIQSPECVAAEERRETSERNDGECARETGRGLRV